MNREAENKRAERIAFRIGEYHSLLSDTYENLTDRNFPKAHTDIKFLISELKATLKSIEDDDF
jgi:hypothetical protein